MKRRKPPAMPGITPAKFVYIVFVAVLAWVPVIALIIVLRLIFGV